VSDYVIPALFRVKIQDPLDPERQDDDTSDGITETVAILIRGHHPMKWVVV
jgi:hypothetical protein